MSREQIPELGAWIRELRIKAGFSSQAELARAAGVHPKTIYNAENGWPVSLGTRRRIAPLLHVATGALVALPSTRRQLDLSALFRKAWHHLEWLPPEMTLDVLERFQTYEISPSDRLQLDLLMAKIFRRRARVDLVDGLARRHASSPAAHVFEYESSLAWMTSACLHPEDPDPWWKSLEIITIRRLEPQVDAATFKNDFARLTLLVNIRTYGLILPTSRCWRADDDRVEGLDTAAHDWQDSPYWQEEDGEYHHRRFVNGLRARCRALLAMKEITLAARALKEIEHQPPVNSLFATIDAFLLSAWLDAERARLERAKVTFANAQRLLAENPDLLLTRFAGYVASRVHQ